MSHDHHHHEILLHALSASVHEHVHGPECGHIHVHTGSLCARGLCGHIEHRAALQNQNFRQMLEPDFLFDDDDDEAENEFNNMIGKSRKVKLT